jgi:hypothetical protein
MSLSRYQLERADLITEIEQPLDSLNRWGRGSRVEREQFQENHRGIRTMGELLKARVFEGTQWAIDLRRRMFKFQGGGSPPVTRGTTAARSPEPHKFPCEDPYCMPCAEAIKRIFRDLNLLPKGNHGADYTVDPITGRLKVPLRYRRDESDK